MSTIYSNTNFKIATPTEDLDSGKYFAKGNNYIEEVKKLFDKNLLINYADTRDGCYAGMYFKEGHVGMIS